MTDLRLTLTDIEAGFRYLEELGYTPPKTLTADAWRQEFRFTPPPAFATALRHWAREDKGAYWPRPGQVMAHLPTVRGPVPASCRAPDDRTHGWYVIHRKADGPRVRCLPHSEARRRGLALPDDVTCPDEGCGCEAVECELAPADFGLSKIAAQDSPLTHALQHPRGWHWYHVAVARKLQPVRVTP